jgi:DnaJ-class molecular chaperone
MNGTELCPECHGFLAMACPTCRGLGMVAATPKIQAVIGATAWSAHLCEPCLGKALEAEPHLEVYPSREPRCTKCGAH